MSDLLNSASLVMIPSGYKEDTVYSVVPSDGSGDLSFTRASNGTRVNSAGLVEVVAWNELTYSEDFTNAAWTKVNATVTANSTTAPNGTNTATKFESVASGVPQLSRAITGTNTISIYAKAGNISSFRIWIGSEVIFDLSTGTVTAGTATMENVGNGWYRCIISSTSAASVNPYFVSTASGQFVYVWGGQINIGSTAKPYFPTTDRLNVPRLTYQNGGGGCPSLLLEKQSTNEANYSQQFDDSYWYKNYQSVTANATTSPDGTQNADLLIPSAGTGDHYLLSQTVSNISGQVVTLTLFVKKKENDYFYFGTGGASAFGAVVYQFSTNTFVVSGLSATATNFGNGWIRLSITGTTGATDLRFLFTPTDSTGSRTYNANGTDGTYIWGAQSEASSYPTSYIPTTSSSATRVADACSKTGISSLIGQTEGVVFWDINVDILSATGNESILNIDNGAGFGETIYFSKGSNGLLYAEVYVGATVQCSFTYSLPSVGRYKMALAYKANDFAFYVNGVSRGTDSSGSVPTCSRLQMGQTALGSSDGKTNQAILFPTRLTNAELASLTTI